MGDYINQEKPSKKEKNKNWILELTNEGKSIKEIAEITGLKAGTVHFYKYDLRKEGKLGPNKTRVLSKEDKKKIVLELYQKGKESKEIAGILGIHIVTVYQYIKELKNDGKIIEDKKDSKKEKRNEKILELIEQGKTVKEISEIMDINIYTLYGYIRELRYEKAKNNKNDSNEFIEKLSLKVRNKEITLDDIKKALGKKNNFVKAILTYTKVCISLEEYEEAKKYIEDNSEKIEKLPNKENIEKIYQLLDKKTKNIDKNHEK